jgi:hypothetical protein
MSFANFKKVLDGVECGLLFCADRGLDSCYASCS